MVGGAPPPPESTLSNNEEGFQVNLGSELSSFPDKTVKYLHVTYKF